MSEIIILGAGIIGISTAWQLQARGQQVTLVDRADPATGGATFGNAGMIHGEAVFPLAFPRNPAELLRFGLNRTPALHYHLRALPALAPFLLAYWRHSAPKRHREIATAYSALVLNSLDAHLALAQAAGARDQIIAGGCFSIFRTRKGERNAVGEAERSAAAFDIDYDVLDAEQYAGIEPFISNVAGAVHWRDSMTVRDPQALAQAYFENFRKLGGTFVKAPATALKHGAAGWSLNHDGDHAEAERLVVALGARSGSFAKSLGYRFPLHPKRGYHLHYGAEGNAVLNHTIIDREDGFSLAPMDRGIRLTTGIEFADIDAPKSPVQLARANRSAREIFPLDGARDDAPWMGERPCLPDMLPVIGKAPTRDDLWFAFGHGHQGLTMGPVTGHLLADMMTGETPLIDPHPYRPERFWE